MNGQKGQSLIRWMWLIERLRMDIMNEISVVYFSKDENTKIGAEFVGQHEAAKMIELIEGEKGNFVQEIFHRVTQLEGEPWIEFDKSKLVYLMLPIWTKNGVPAVNTFIEKADFTGKTVRLITFQQMAEEKNIKKVHELLSNNLHQKGATVKDRYAFLGDRMGKCLPKEQIEAQVCTVFYENK